MSFPRVIILGSVSLFAMIGLLGIVKKMVMKTADQSEKIRDLTIYKDAINELPSERKFFRPIIIEGNFPKIDRMSQLFDVKEKNLPIVETITYSSSVPWLKGRPAWISDYAMHFSTSRHFIARSLCGKPQYVTPTVFEGNRFNVFSNEKQIQFYLVIDLSHCKMGVYSYDLEKDERIFLKAYSVGLGRFVEKGHSLTPEGLFTLGENVGVFEKGNLGYHLGKKVELIQVFGTRWLPIEGKGVKGLGIQGMPWISQEKNEQLKEDRSSLEKYETDGCIRMTQEGIEELYAIVVAKPTFILIVSDLSKAELPGKEINSPL